MAAPEELQHLAATSFEPPRHAGVIVLMHETAAAAETTATIAEAVPRVPPLPHGWAYYTANIGNLDTGARSIRLTTPLPIESASTADLASVVPGARPKAHILFYAPPRNRNVPVEVKPGAVIPRVPVILTNPQMAHRRRVFPEGCPPIIPQGETLVRTRVGVAPEHGAASDVVGDFFLLGGTEALYRSRLQEERRHVSVIMSS